MHDTEWSDARKRQLIEDKQAHARARGDGRGLRDRVARVDVSQSQYPHAEDAAARVRTLDFRADRRESRSGTWQFRQRDLIGKETPIALEPGVTAVVIHDGQRLTPDDVLGGRTT